MRVMRHFAVILALLGTPGALAGWTDAQHRDFIEDLRFSAHEADAQSIVAEAFGEHRSGPLMRSRWENRKHRLPVVSRVTPEQLVLLPSHAQREILRMATPAHLRRFVNAVVRMPPDRLRDATLNLLVVALVEAGDDFLESTAKLPFGFEDYGAFAAGTAAMLAGFALEAGWIRHIGNSMAQGPGSIGSVVLLALYLPPIVAGVTVAGVVRAMQRTPRLGTTVHRVDEPFLSREVALTEEARAAIAELEKTEAELAAQDWTFKQQLAALFILGRIPLKAWAGHPCAMLLRLRGL